MDRLKLQLYVGPVYELKRDRYACDFLLVPFETIEFHAPRGSNIVDQNDRRPSRKMRKIHGIVEERVKLYPSNDTLGRRDCVDQVSWSSTLPSKQSHQSLPPIALQLSSAA